MKEQWSEIRKEYEIDDNGNRVLKKVTIEREYQVGNRSYPAQLFFQGISALGILIVLCGILVNVGMQHFQNRNQLRQQRYQFEIGIFTNAIHTITNISDILNNGGVLESNYMRSINNLDSETRPSIRLLNNRKLDEYLSAMRIEIRAIEGYATIRDQEHILQTQFLHENLYKQDSVLMYDSSKYSMRLPSILGKLNFVNKHGINYHYVNHDLIKMDIEKDNAMDSIMAKFKVYFVGCDYGKTYQTGQREFYCELDKYLSSSIYSQQFYNFHVKMFDSISSLLISEMQNSNGFLTK